MWATQPWLVLPRTFVSLVLYIDDKKMCVCVEEVKDVQRRGDACMISDE